MDIFLTASHDDLLHKPLPVLPGRIRAVGPPGNEMLLERDFEIALIGYEAAGKPSIEHVRSLAFSSLMSSVGNSKARGRLQQVGRELRLRSQNKKTRTKLA